MKDYKEIQKEVHGCVTDNIKRLRAQGLSEKEVTNIMGMAIKNLRIQLDAERKNPSIENRT